MRLTAVSTASAVALSDTGDKVISSPDGSQNLALGNDGLTITNLSVSGNATVGGEAVATEPYVDQAAEDKLAELTNVSGAYADALQAVNDALANNQGAVDALDSIAGAKVSQADLDAQLAVKADKTTVNAELANKAARDELVVFITEAVLESALSIYAKTDDLPEPVDFSDFVTAEFVASAVTDGISTWMDAAPDDLDTITKITVAIAENQDVISALTAIVSGKPSFADLNDGLATKAAVTHTHAVSEVSGLQSALDSKAPSSHGHEMSAVIGLISALADKASLSHDHQISNVLGLVEALAAKASLSKLDEYVKAVVLATTLQSYATQDDIADHVDLAAVQSEVNSALSELIGVVPEHLNTLQGLGSAIQSNETLISDLQALASDKVDQSAFDAAMNGKADTGHDHSVAAIVGLVEALAGKADGDHAHDITAISGLFDALAAKADGTALTAGLSAKADAGDLAGLAAETYVDQAVQGLADNEGVSAAISAAISGLVTTGALSAAVADKLDSSALADYVTNAALSTALIPYAKTDDLPEGVDLSDFVTSGDIASFVDIAAVNAAIATKIAELVGNADEALDTIEKIAAQIGNNIDVITAIQTSVGNRVTVEAFNLAMAEKVDQTAFDTAINLKADASQLASYVSSTSLTTTLEPYAKTADLPEAVDLSAYALSTDISGFLTGTQVDAEIQGAVQDFVTTTAFNSALSDKAASGHSHSVSDTTGLQGALDDKLDAGAHGMFTPAVRAITVKAIDNDHPVSIFSSQNTGNSFAIDVRRVQGTANFKPDLVIALGLDNDPHELEDAVRFYNHEKKVDFLGELELGGEGVATEAYVDQQLLNVPARRALSYYNSSQINSVTHGDIAANWGGRTINLLSVGATTITLPNGSATPTASEVAEGFSFVLHNGNSGSSVDFDIHGVSSSDRRFVDNDVSQVKIGNAVAGAAKSFRFTCVDGSQLSNMESAYGWLITPLS